MRVAAPHTRNFRSAIYIFNACDCTSHSYYSFSYLYFQCVGLHLTLVFRVQLSIFSMRVTASHPRISRSLIYIFYACGCTSQSYPSFSSRYFLTSCSNHFLTGIQHHSCYLISSSCSSFSNLYFLTSCYNYFSQQSNIIRTFWSQARAPRSLTYIFKHRARTILSQESSIIRVVWFQARARRSLIYIF